MANRTATYPCRDRDLESEEQIKRDPGSRTSFKRSLDEFIDSRKEISFDCTLSY